MKMVIGYWSLVISKEAETKKGRRETVSRKLVWLFVICDLEFGFYSFTDSWRTWRFIIPRPKQEK
jgi:hypothetical protein